MVRLSLSKVTVRLCSAPRAASGRGSSSLTRRATSVSRPRSASENRIRSGRSAGIGSTRLEDRADTVQDREVDVVQRLVGRGMRLASGGLMRSPVELIGQQGAHLRQAPAAGGADAPDRHAERGRHRRVVRTRHERDDPQQLLAPLGELADRPPQRYAAARRGRSAPRIPAP